MQDKPKRMNLRKRKQPEANASGAAAASPASTPEPPSSSSKRNRKAPAEPAAAQASPSPPTTTPKKGGARGRSSSSSKGRGGGRKTSSAAGASDDAGAGEVRVSLKRVTTVKVVEPGESSSAGKRAGKKSPARGKGKKAASPAGKAGDAKKKGGGVARLKRQQSSLIVARTGVTAYDADPMFHGKNPVPEISMDVNDRLAIRHAIRGDVKALQKMIDDKKGVASLLKGRSVNCPRNALAFAVKHGQIEAAKLLADYEKAGGETAGRVAVPESLLVSRSSGQYNFRTLGHAVRPVAATRGGREGNNALTQEPTHDWRSNPNEMTEIVSDFVTDIAVLDDLVAQEILSFDEAERMDLSDIIRRGQHKLAGKIIEQYQSGQDFNELHKCVLLFTKQDLPSFRAISVKKKGRSARNIMPIHCACINPNLKYLKALIDAEPNFNEADAQRWTPLHYAAVCEDPAPLKYLNTERKLALNRSEVNTSGETLLHVAALANRPKNVEYILKKAPEMFDARSREGYTALHYAAMHGHTDVVNVFIAAANAKSANMPMDILAGAARKKVTPLMLAAQHGHLDVVKLLVDAGAKANLKDKLKRSPLIHAVLDGQAHVTSFLLRLGVNANTADSSGNTAVHYAAAYGWIFDLRLLVEAGAKLTMDNDWRLTPLGVAYLKGHMGICDWLLERLPPGAINCRDEQGLSLLSLTLSSAPPSDQIYQQTEYLLRQKSAEPNTPDSLGNSALHHLSVTFDPDAAGDKAPSVAKQGAATVKIAKLLIEHGVDCERKNEEGFSPLVTSLRAGNTWLAVYLMDRGVPFEYDEPALLEKNRGLLWKIVRNLKDDSRMMEVLCAQYSQKVTELLGTRIKDGFTPFLWLVHKFCRLLGRKSPDSSSGNSRRYRRLRRIQGGRSYFNYYYRNNGESSADEHKRKLTRYYEVMRMWIHLAPELVLGQEVVRPRPREPFNPGARRNDDNVDEAESEDSDMEEDEDEDQDDDDGSENGRSKKKEEKTGDDGTIIGASLVDLNHVYHGQQALDLVAASQLPEDVAHNQHNAHMRQMAFRMFFDTLADLSVEKKAQALSHTDSNNLTAVMTAFLAKNHAFIDIFKPTLHLSDKHQWRLTKQLQQKLQKELGGGGDDQSTGESFKLGEISIVALAVQAGMPEAVKIYADTFDQRELAKTDGLGNSVLHYAAMHPQLEDIVEVARILIAKCPPLVNAPNAFGRTPMHFAVNADSASADSSTELIEFLLSKGADLAKRDYQFRNPFHCAFIKFVPHGEGERSPGGGKGRNGIAFDPVAVSLILLRRPGIKDVLLASDSHGMTVLHCAASVGATICIGQLTKHADLMSFIRAGGDSPRPLSLASRGKHVGAALALIQSGASLRQVATFPVRPEDRRDWKRKNLWQWKPMREEIPQLIKLKTSVFELVIENDWQGVLHMFLDGLDGMADNRSVLVAALKHRQYNLASMLAKKYRKLFTVVGNPNIPSDPGFYLSPLFEHADTTAASVGQIMKVADTLVKTRVDSWDMPATKNTASARVHPVLHAARAQSTKLLAALGAIDEMKVHLDFQHKREGSAFLQPCPASGGHTVITSLLYKCDTLPEPKFEAEILPIIESAIRYTSPAFVLNVMADFPKQKAPAVDTPHKTETEKKTLLGHLVSFGSLDLVRALVKLGANVNYAPEGTLPPLVWAARRNDPHIVALLLNRDYMPVYADGKKAEVGRPGARLFQIASPAKAARAEENKTAAVMETDDGAAADVVVNQNDVTADPNLEQTAAMDTGVGGSGADEKTENEVVDPNIEATAAMDTDPVSPRSDTPEVGAEDRSADISEDDDAEAEEDNMQDGDGDDDDVEEDEQEEGIISDEEQEDEEDEEEHEGDVSDGEGGKADKEDGEDDEGGSDGEGDDEENGGGKKFAIPKKVKVTSEIDVDWRSEGKGYLHYVLEAAGHHTAFADGHVLKLLLASGFGVPEGSPKLADLAQSRGLFALREVLGVGEGVNWSSESMESAFDPPVGSSGDVLANLGSLGGFDPDKIGEYAQQLVADTAAKQPPKPVEKKRPNPVTGMQDTGELVADEHGTLYDVMLAKVDLATGNHYGMFNFYEIQLIKRRGADLFVLLTRWGRIGEYPGQYQQTPFGTKEEAEKEFQSVFRSKTKNKWDTYSTNGEFTPHEKKYRFLDQKAQKTAASSEDAEPTKELTTHLRVNPEIDLSSDLDSKLPKDMQRVISDLADPDIVGHEIMSTFHNLVQGDIFGTGFAGISDDNVQAARDILGKLMGNFNDLREAREKHIKSKDRSKGSGGSATWNRVLECHQRCVTLTAELYHVLPFTNYAYMKLPVFDSVRQISELETALTSVIHLHTAGKLLCAAALNRTICNPLDAIYASLGLDLQMADPNGPMIQTIMQYIRASSPTARIHSILSVVQQKEGNQEAKSGTSEDKFLSDPNRRLLWHGTSAHHLLSILKEGLLPAPAHAAQCGQMLGRGIYLADKFSKSISYCRASQHGLDYMLLCEAALGRQRPIQDPGSAYQYDDDYSRDPLGKGKFDSVLGLGSSVPDPSKDVIVPGGCIIPLGAATERPPMPEEEQERLDITYFSLSENEYVVFDPDRVRVRYVVVFK